MRRIALIAFLVSFAGLLGAGGIARAGHGGSTGAIEAAVSSGSADAIIAEVERAEELTCYSCYNPVHALIDNPSSRVRDVAGWWLSKRPERRTVLKEMIARLQTSQDPLATRNAADILTAMRDAATLPALIAYLAHPLDEDSGRSALRAIGAIGDPAAVSALTTALSSPLAGVRAQAAVALRQIRPPAGLKHAATVAMLTPLVTDADAQARMEAIQTLATLRDERAIPQLALAIGDPSPQVRRAVVWALGEIGQYIMDGSNATLAQNALVSALSDSDPFVRSLASGAKKQLH